MLCYIAPWPSGLGMHTISVAEIAFALGTSAESIRVARELPGPESARELPEDWREQIADLVRGRGARLEELGQELKAW